MKPNLKFLLLIAVSCLTACTKLQDIKPAHPFDLYGVWFCPDGGMQFSIQDITGHDVTGRGNNPKYTDIHKDDRRYLKVEIGGDTRIYEITHIDDHSLILKDSQGVQYNLLKAHLPVNLQ